MKIGIYSGTFDPVHLGHVAFARAAAEQCGLDKVYFLVEPRPRRKQGVKALEHRQAMVGIAIEKELKLGSIILEHARFSVAKTLPVLQARFKGSEIAFLMGDDTLMHFTDVDWPGLDEFVRTTALIVGLRQRSEKEIQQHINLIEKTRGVKIRYQTFVGPMSKHNSGNVRLALRKGGNSSDIDPRVSKYIRDNQLYTPSELQD